MNKAVLYFLGGCMLLFLIAPLGWLGWTAVQQTAAITDWTAVLSPLWITIWTSTVTLLIMILFGTPLAYWQTAWQGKWQRWGYALTDLPIVLPPSVAGVGLLLLYGRSSALGNLLQQLGVGIPFTPLAVIFAQLFVAAPFYIRAVRTGMLEIGRAYLESAQVEGANEWQLFSQVLWPMSRRAVLSGMVLGWSRAIGEFGATLLFAGNLFGKTQTMPIAIYLQFESQQGIAFLLAAVLIAIAYSSIIFMSQFAQKST